MPLKENENTVLPEWLTIKLSWNQKKRLVPFFATWMIYMITCVPTIGAVIIKILPIHCLCFYIFNENEQTLKRDQKFIRGLLCSSLGDICLIWIDSLFVPGLVWYAVALVHYIQAMDMANRKSVTWPLYAAFGTIVLLYIHPGIESYSLKGLVVIYTGLVLTMCWMATARYETEPTKNNLMGCIGGSLFVLSNLIFAVDRWFINIPVSSELSSFMYYSAQLYLALSISKEFEGNRIQEKLSDLVDRGSDFLSDILKEEN